MLGAAGGGVTVPDTEMPSPVLASAPPEAALPAGLVPMRLPVIV